MKSWIRDHPIAAAAIGTLLAIAATTAMDAVGLSNFSAFPLIPLFVLFWYLQRMSRAEIGSTSAIRVQSFGPSSVEM